MKALFKHIRLLPAVIAGERGTARLEGEGLVREAWAQEQAAPASDTDVLAQDTAPLPKDSADDSKSSSPAEVDVLTSLAKRRAALDAREADIQARSDLLAAAESRVDGKIATSSSFRTKSRHFWASATRSRKSRSPRW